MELLDGTFARSDSVIACYSSRTRAFACSYHGDGIRGIKREDGVPFSFCKIDGDIAADNKSRDTPKPTVRARRSSVGRAPIKLDSIRRCLRSIAFMSAPNIPRCKMHAFFSRLLSPPVGGTDENFVRCDVWIIHHLFFSSFYILGKARRLKTADDDEKFRTMWRRKCISRLSFHEIYRKRNAPRSLVA